MFDGYTCVVTAISAGVSMSVVVYHSLKEEMGMGMGMDGRTMGMGMDGRTMGMGMGTKRGRRMLLVMSYSIMIAWALLMVLRLRKTRFMKHRNGDGDGDGCVEVTASTDNSDSYSQVSNNPK